MTAFTIFAGRSTESSEPRWAFDFQIRAGEIGSPMKTTNRSKLLAARDANWQAEMGGHLTYKALAEKEADPQRN